MVEAYSIGMDVVKVAVIGAGSVRCSPAVIGSLANYYGERPLELRFADADAERLDLFDRLACYAFKTANSDHVLLSTEDFFEAMDGADRVIVQIGANCARKILRQNGIIGGGVLDDGTLIEAAVGHVLSDCGDQADVLSLMAPEVRLPLDHYYRLNWPGPLDGSNRASMPHQILRWLREDEDIVKLLDQHLSSPLKAWLVDRTMAESVFAE